MTEFYSYPDIKQASSHYVKLQQCNLYFLFALTWKHTKNVFLVHEEWDCPIIVFFFKKINFLPKLNAYFSTVNCWRNTQMPHYIFQNRACSKNFITKYDVGGFWWLDIRSIWQEIGLNITASVEMLPNFSLTCYQLKQHPEVLTAAEIWG